MIELTWIPGALRALFGVYVALGIAALLTALIKPKTAAAKIGWACAVILGFGLIPFLAATSGGGNSKASQAGQEKLKVAMAHFEMRCKSAGEKINRTVENVEGVVWMKWRERISNADNFADQFKLNDPYGQDCGAEDCILNLLRVTKGADLNPDEAQRHAKGYSFVESIDPRDGNRYRYTGVIKLRPIWTAEAIAREKSRTGRDMAPWNHAFILERELIDRFSATNGITWDDISTREDREKWIAGGSLRVIDRQTNDVLAERVGYMIDRGQGSQHGFRSPWLFAVENACPEFVREPKASRRGRTLHESSDFVMKVLQPTQGK